MNRPPKILATAALAMALAAATVQAQNDAASERSFYRVEAIVVTVSGGDSDAWPEGALESHTGARDPAWQAFARQRSIERAESEAGGEASEMQTALDVVDVIASLESGEESLTEALVYPEPWLALDTLSEPMAAAAERLERTGSFRVQASLAWYQPIERGESSPAVRIHDDLVLSAEWLELDPLGRLRHEGRPIETVLDVLPGFDYRLDGTIRLRQRQFMHADIDLGWRRPATIGFDFSASPVAEGAFEVHRLEQSRTVRPGRFEYFDSEWLGLLLRVTPFEPEGAEGDGRAQDEPAEEP